MRHRQPGILACSVERDEARVARENRVTYLTVSRQREMLPFGTALGRCPLRRLSRAPRAPMRTTMLLPKKILRSWPIDRVCPVLLFGLLLASVDYLMDIIMDYFGTSASKTIRNDLATGILGGAAVYFYLKARCQKCDFESVREHMNLIGSLNRGIRSGGGVGDV